MQSAASFTVLFAITGCSLDHVVVAALDDVSAAGSMATTTAAAGGGAANAGSGGEAVSGRSPTSGTGGTVWIVSGGSGGSVSIGSSTAEPESGSETRCSCLGQTREVCGTDGVTYPTACGDAENCMPPGIACLQACPCGDENVGSAGVAAFSWFPASCVTTARCREGVVCMSFSDRELSSTPPSCPSD